MSKRISLLSGLAAIALLGLSQATHAATFNFQTFSEGDWNAVTGGSLTVGGITLTATATGTGNPRAYLDSPSGGLPAGLGVCSLAGSCAGSSDDNVGFSQDNISLALEHLILTFTSSPVQLTNLTFRNRDHGLYNGNLLINGSMFSVVAGSLALSLSGTSFDFTPISTGQLAINRDFYIGGVTATAVPGPIVGAGLPGLVIAFGGMMLWWRRRQALQT